MRRLTKASPYERLAVARALRRVPFLSSRAKRGIPREANIRVNRFAGILRRFAPQNDGALTS